MSKPILYVVTALWRYTGLDQVAQSLTLLDPWFAVRWLPVGDCAEGSDGTGKRNIALRMIERLDPGWIFHLDDDNLIHPSFGQALADGILQHPAQQVFFFKLVRANGELCIAEPKVIPYHVDTASYVVSTEVARGVYWTLENNPATPDYDWIARICAKSGLHPLLLDALAYHNGNRPPG